MEHFPIQNNNENKNTLEGSILNDWDRKILLEGGEGVINKILEQNGVPDVIILPETSARPLYYLVDPSFKKIAEEQQVKPPKYIFFAPSKPDWITAQATYHHNPEDFLLIDLDSFKKESLDEAEMLHDISPITGQRILDDKEYEEVKKDIDTSFKNKENDQKRAQELLEKIGSVFGESPKIIILDEFILNGHTSKDIIRSFNKKIPSYAIFDVSTSGYSDGTGITVLDDNKNPSNNAPGSLSYQNPNLERSTGVIKENGNPIATALRKTENFTTEDQGKINALRKEMKVLGEELSSKF